MNTIEKKNLPMAQTMWLASFGPIFVAAAHPKLPIGARDAHSHRAPAATAIAAPQGVSGGRFCLYMRRGDGLAEVQTTCP